MSDLTDKLVNAVQSGQLQFGDVVSRLTDQEKQDFGKSLESFSQNEVNREDQSLGEMKWPARAATAAGAGLGAAMIPAGVGGAGLTSALTSAIPAGTASGLGQAAKWGAMGYGISKLPEGLRTPAELMMIMMGMGGKGGGLAAGEAAGVAEGKAIGGASRTMPMTDEAFTASTGRARGTARRMPKSNPTYADVAERAQGGGGVAIEQNGTPVRPGPLSMRKAPPSAPPSNDPPNLIREPGGSNRQPLDEADKRKIMFGGAGEGIDTRPEKKGPTKLRKAK